LYNHPTWINRIAADYPYLLRKNFPGVLTPGFQDILLKYFYRILQDNIRQSKLYKNFFPANPPRWIPEAL
jgi:hypothetical protein